MEKTTLNQQKPDPHADKADKESAVLERSPQWRDPTALWASGSMRSSRPARQPSRRNSGTGCPHTSRTAKSSASSVAGKSLKRGT